MRKVIIQLCWVVIVTILAYACYSYNMVPENKQEYEEEINAEKYSIPNIELEKISANEILVKEKRVQFEGVSDDTLRWYADQIEKCPDYLLATVEEIHIVTHDRLLELRPDASNKIIGYHKHYGSYSKIILSDYKTDDRTVFLHEAIHAYDAQYGITEMPKFQNIYATEGLDYDERVSDVKEYFAYSYVDYLTDNLNKSKYPLTAEFYQNTNYEK